MEMPSVGAFKSTTVNNFFQHNLMSNVANISKILIRLVLKSMISVFIQANLVANFKTAPT